MSHQLFEIMLHHPQALESKPPKCCNTSSNQFSPLLDMDPIYLTYPLTTLQLLLRLFQVTRENSSWKLNLLVRNESIRYYRMMKLN